MNPEKPAKQHSKKRQNDEPARDWFEYLASAGPLPPPDEPIEDRIARIRQNFANGEDFMVEMHDGSGPRLASEVFEDVIDQNKWALMQARILRNLERMTDEEIAQWHKQR